MWQDSLIEGHQSKMDDDDNVWRDDWYKQDSCSGVSHINVCEGIRGEPTKKVREREMMMDVREARKVKEGVELGEDSIW